MRMLLATAFCAILLNLLVVGPSAFAFFCKSVQNSRLGARKKSGGAKAPPDWAA
jgi:hypothetical protein